MHFQRCLNPRRLGKLRSFSIRYIANKGHGNALYKIANVPRGFNDYSVVNGWQHTCCALSNQCVIMRAWSTILCINVYPNSTIKRFTASAAGDVRNGVVGVPAESSLKHGLCKCFRATHVAYQDKHWITCCQGNVLANL